MSRASELVREVPGKLVRAAHVHERAALRVQGAVDLGQEIDMSGSSLGRSPTRHLGHKRATLGKPLLSAAVHQAHVLTARPSSATAPKQQASYCCRHRGSLLYPCGCRTRPSSSRRRLYNDVALYRAAKLDRPVPRDRAWNVALFVSCRIDVHLDEANAFIVSMLRNPVGLNENFGKCYCCGQRGLSMGHR